ncbi:hypothetical protein K456DRAFT_58001, partial [Colletotrichum gloeosporioides 23]
MHIDQVYSHLSLPISHFFYLRRYVLAHRPHSNTARTAQVRSPLSDPNSLLLPSLFVTLFFLVPLSGYCLVLPLCPLQSAAGGSLCPSAKFRLISLPLALALSSTCDRCVFILRPQLYEAAESSHCSYTTSSIDMAQFPRLSSPSSPFFPDFLLLSISFCPCPEDRRC